MYVKKLVDFFYILHENNVLNGSFDRLINRPMYFYVFFLLKRRLIYCLILMLLTTLERASMVGRVFRYNFSEMGGTYIK